MTQSLSHYELNDLLGRLNNGGRVDEGGRWVAPCTVYQNHDALLAELIEARANIVALRQEVDEEIDKRNKLEMWHEYNHSARLNGKTELSFDKWASIPVELIALSSDLNRS